MELVFARIYRTRTGLSIRAKTSSIRPVDRDFWRDQIWRFLTISEKSPISAILAEIVDFSTIGAKMADFEIAGSVGADFFADLNLS